MKKILALLVCFMILTSCVVTFPTEKPIVQNARINIGAHIINEEVMDISMLNKNIEKSCISINSSNKEREIRSFENLCFWLEPQEIAPVIIVNKGVSLVVVRKYVEGLAPEVKLNESFDVDDNDSRKVRNIHLVNSSMLKVLVILQAR